MRTLILSFLFISFSFFFTTNVFADSWKIVQRGSLTYVKNNNSILCKIVFSEDQIIAGAISMNLKNKFSKMEFIEVWLDNNIIQKNIGLVTEEGYIENGFSDQMFETYCKDPDGLPKELVQNKLTQVLFL